jgi:hypothetical protein
VLAAAKYLFNSHLWRDSDATGHGTSALSAPLREPILILRAIAASREQWRHTGTHE